MKTNIQQRITTLESNLLDLSQGLQQLNKRLEDTQLQWNELIALHARVSINTPKEDIVTYQDSFDEQRQAALLSTNFQASQKTFDDVISEVNYNVYHQMHCAKGLSAGSIADSLIEYRRLLTQIINENPSLKFVTAHELSQANKDLNASYCQLRHDVDADISACLTMAKIEADLGIKSTYFLLHTASYFGEWRIDKVSKSATFFRNEALAELYLKLQTLGHEVAMHTDPLHLYQNLNVDGALALVTEINWLRSQGISIKGTAPHNNPGEYGASNSAIFCGRKLDFIKQNDYLGVIKNEKWAPLSQLDEKSLNLDYEADDVFLPGHGMSVDFISLVCKNKWYRFFKTPDLMEWEQVRDDRYDHYENSMPYWKNELPDIYKSEKDLYLTSDFLSSACKQRAPKIIILSIHPEHFGYRENENSPPLNA